MNPEWHKNLSASDIYIHCNSCDDPMFGIMDAIARETCYDCGGQSLCTGTLERHAQRKRIKHRAPRHKIYIKSPGGGGIAA